jgi:hypothetical protein
VLKVKVEARSDNGAHFLIDLSYAGCSAFATCPKRRSGPSC